MTVTNHRLDCIAGMINDQGRAIEEIVTSFEVTIRQTVTTQALLHSLASRMIIFMRVMDNLNEFRLGVEQLVQGFLTPIMIHQSDLRAVIAEINIRLERDYPGFRLIYQDPSDYYKSHNFILVRHGYDLFIHLKFPITLVDADLTLFETETFALPVPGSDRHTTQIVDLPRYIITARKSL